MEDRYHFHLPEGFDAFSYAEDYVDRVLLPDAGVIAENREWLRPNLESDWFRPSLELQVAGLSLLTGRLGGETFAVGFACSAIDHIVAGWNAMLLSFPRVAYTLCRNVVEASIFEVAEVACRLKFRESWQSNRATGGKILRMLGRTQVPGDLLMQLQQSWKFVVSYGHVSPIPTAMASGVGPKVPENSVTAQVLGGPQNGKLPEGVLFHLGGALSMIGETSMYGFAWAFRQSMAEQQVWLAKFEEHRVRIEKRLANGRRTSK